MPRYTADAEVRREADGEWRLVGVWVGLPRARGTFYGVAGVSEPCPSREHEAGRVRMEPLMALLAGDAAAAGSLALVVARQRYRPIDAMPPSNERRIEPPAMP